MYLMRRKQQMDEKSMELLLGRAAVGRFSTINRDGYPYTIAMHFIYADGNIYFHCAKEGEKLENIAANPKVCFEVDEMKVIHIGDENLPCNISTGYESVLVFGEASVLRDTGKKREVLGKILQKYAPSCAEMEIPEAAAEKTAVVELVPCSRVGKYHK